MLDSLVRVSRRVGWGANRFATDPRCQITGDTPRPDGRAVRAHSLRVCPSRTHRTGLSTRALREEAGSATGIPRSPGRPAPSRSITLPSHEGQGSYLPGRLRQPGNRSWRSPRRKCTGPRASQGGQGAHESTSQIPPRHQGSRLNSAGRLCGPIRLPLSGFTYS